MEKTKETYVLKMDSIAKEYSGNRVLKGVSLHIRPGEIHALMGENGAGKSTLMNILFGMPVIHNTGGYEGTIEVAGKPVKIDTPLTAMELGIGMVHQEFMLIPGFTVMENIKIGREISKPNLASRIFGRSLETLDFEAMAEDARKALKTIGLQIDEYVKVAGLPVGYMQFIEIARELDKTGIRILVFDEPTAVLTPQEIEELMEIMRGFKEEGKSILFITHKLNEIMAVADRCTVLQKGRGIGTVEIAKTTKEELSRMMVGRDVEFAVEKKPCELGRTILEVDNLVVPSKVHKNNAVKNVTFTVRAGEIVCVAGIEGNGQSELIYGLTGLEKVTGGSIRLNGKDITNATIRERSKDGMSHIPEDRHKHGLVLDYTLADNMVLQRYWQPQFQNHGFIKKGEVLSYAERLIEQYDVRSGQGPQTIARSMSGGNQQKAIIAREVDKDPDLLVAVQPTRGLDVGAIEYIHKQIVAERDKGKAVLLVSLELDEVMNLSDRILVMYEGEIVGEFDPHKTTVEELGLYMAGAKKQGEAKA